MVALQQLSHSLICARPCGFPLRNPYSSHSSSAVIVPSKNRRAISLIRSFMARIFVARSKSYNNSKSLYPTCLIEKKRSSGISSARSRRLHLFLLRRPFAARPGSSQSSRPHGIKNKKEKPTHAGTVARTTRHVRNPDESGSAHASAKALRDQKFRGKIRC